MLCKIQWWTHLNSWWLILWFIPGTCLNEKDVTTPYLKFVFVIFIRTYQKSCSHLMCLCSPSSIIWYLASRDPRIVFFRSNLESNRPYTTQAVFLFYLTTISQFSPVQIRNCADNSCLHFTLTFHPSVFCICDEREWCTDYGTPNGVLVYFNPVKKCVKQCCCTLILLPKSTLNANLTTTNRFFTNDDWQCGRFENFESEHQYESNLESDVRFEIESNHEVSQVPSTKEIIRLGWMLWKRSLRLEAE